MTCSFALFLFAYIFFIREVKELSARKLKESEELRVKKNRIEKLSLEKKGPLADPERIYSISRDSLKMIQGETPIDIFSISKDRINETQKAIDRGYE